MCDLDMMYAEDLNKNKKEDIDDERLIVLVEKNPLLYDKKQKDFKNVALKKDTWTAIAYGCGAPTGEDAEQRWNTLRNLLGRRKRELQAGPSKPSGSAGGKKNTPWPLLGLMSFLLPYMENRKKRGTTLGEETEERSDTASPALSKSSRQSPDLVHSAWDSMSQIVSPGYADSNLDEGYLDDPSLECIIPSPTPTDCGQESPCEKGETNGKAKRKASGGHMPAPDDFAKKKKNKLDGIENIMKQSACAMEVVAKALAAPENSKQGQQEVHPYIAAVAEGFKSVPPEKELACFMSIMRVIEEHK